MRDLLNWQKQTTYRIIKTICIYKSELALGVKVPIFHNTTDIIEQEMSKRHICPPPPNPPAMSYRGHLLTMNNHHTKYKNPVVNG